MNDELKIYQQIAARETKARKLAEQLLEQKSLEMYDQNQQAFQATEDLKNLNSILTNVMLASPDSILTCDPDYRITGMNKKAEKTFGVSEQEALSMHVDEILPVSFLVSQMTDTGQFIFECIEVSPPNGNVFPAEIRGTVDIGTDTRCYLVLFIHDITNRLANEQDRTELLEHVTESRRLESLGSLASGIAHEINTPLQFIGDNTEYIAEALSQINQSYLHYEDLRMLAKTQNLLTEACQAIESYNEKIRLKAVIKNVYDAITDSRAGVGEVKEIINAMRSFMHTGELDFAPTDINETIENVVKLCANKLKSGIKMDLQLKKDLPILECHRGQIQQVLLNIVLNGIDALVEAGITDPEIRITSNTNGANIGIVVSDNGPGVSPALREKIFDPFFTTKSVGKGTGQGLALAKDIVVNRHGGVLKLVEREGFNTSFLICLPLLSQAIDERHIHAA